MPLPGTERSKIDGLTDFERGLLNQSKRLKDPVEPPPPPAPPVTGVLRVFGLVLFAGVIYATLLAYQNAPGDGADKAFTACVTLGILSMALMVLLRTLQHFRQVAVLLIVLVGIDFLANDGGVLRAVLEFSGPAVDQVASWLRYLILGPS